ncbi:MAG: DoxX family protein [Moraxellaceae bacterium]|nr:DoxX family protein [Moraxellaceae bacterium]
MPPSDALSHAALAPDLVARLLIAGLCLPYLISGVLKSFRFAGAVEEFAGLGFPRPAVFAVMTIALQLCASVAVIVLAGWPAALGALALAAFTFSASLMVHAFWKKRGVARFQQTNIFVEHVALTCGLLFVAWWHLSRV